MHELLGEHDNVVTSRIPDREAILGSIKEFLSPQFTNGGTGVINLTGSDTQPIYGAANSGHTFTNLGVLNKQSGSATTQSIGAGNGGSALTVVNGSRYLTRWPLSSRHVA